MQTKHIKLLAVVGVSSTIAFFLYKTVKKVKQEMAFQEAMNADIPEVVIEPEPLEEPEYRLAPRFEVIEEAEDETEVIEAEHENHIDPEDIIEEGVSPLRHPIDSPAALKQFKSMMLAECEPIVRDRMVRLFDFPFVPKTDKDKLVRERLVEERINFFTEDSIHINDITMADLVIHYSEGMDFHLGRGVSYWAELILDNMGIHLNTEYLTIEMVTENVTSHVFVGRFGYGMFGLNTEHYSKMMSMSTPFTFKVDFDLEYDAYLEQQLEVEGSGVYE